MLGIANAIGIPFMRGGGGSQYDPDAAAFFTAVAAAGGSLSLTEKTAYNDFVIASKANGYYTKFKALYPMIGGSATSCMFNAIDPQDTDGAYRITWAGGITFASTGVTGNGTTGYGNTHYVRQTADRNDFGLAFYTRTTPGGGGFPGDIGVNSPAKYAFIILGDSPIYTVNAAANNNPGSTAKGLYSISRVVSTEQKCYVNGSISDTQVTASTAVDSQPMFLLALNTGGTASNFGNKECAFAAIKSGFSDTDEANLYTDLQAFQTELSRQV